MDDKSYPPGGFRTEDALTAKETLLGMTLWAVKACMMDDRIGSLQKGKFADFIVTDKNLLSEKYTANCKILANYIAGEQLLLK
jgi:predicted amidohydrolase YtcJ